jgi:alpha-galactosidase
MLSFWGGHCKERTYQQAPLHYGAQNVFSRRGGSSHQFNPFIALAETGADENTGRVYGFNFVYSGNFLDEVEVDQTGSTRVQIGLGGENFSWQLKAGETFWSPEAVMTFSTAGIGQMSRNFHAFTRNHILPPEPFDKRPVVLNTWEACYFDIDQQEMLRFADAAAEVGIDMLVMDDGWFGKRNDDRAALGDWWVNPEKFPDGLAPFVDKVKSRGIKFGIWIEPEMVNPDSDLYRAHPDWCIHCPSAPRMLSRNQLVLDMGQEAVRDYLKDTFRKTFDGVALDYFKWDFNRHLSQVASAALPADRQGEAAHRFMLGVYDLYRWFRETYPHTMIENCSGGGGRYDLGMMKYSTMIWTSDNTTPQERIGIQYGSMLGYPAATMSCHVSNHHNLCEQPKELKYRGEVAMGGALGYELHLPSASEGMKAGIKEQIATYRRYEDLILRGDYYPIHNPFGSNYSAYCYTDSDRILVSFLQIAPDEGQKVTIPVACAEKGATYRDVDGMEYTGEELQKGLVALCDGTDHNSRMWYLVKI